MGFWIPKELSPFKEDDFYGSARRILDEEKHNWFCLGGINMVTNKEHYMDEFIEEALFGSTCSFFREHVHGGTCKGVCCGLDCAKKAKTWLSQEYKEPSIWSKVPKGTPVWVWKSSQTEDQKQLGQFLFECENGNIVATTGGYESEWRNARLVTPEDLFLP